MVNFKKHLKSFFSPPSVDPVEVWIKKHKLLFQRCVAFLCAIAIMGLTVLCSFLFPKPLKAKADFGSFVSYATDLAPSIAEGVAIGTLSPAAGALLGFQLGLYEAQQTAIQAGHSFDITKAKVLGGLYSHNGDYHYAYCGLDTSTYSPADGGATLFKSDEAEVRVQLIPESYYNVNYNSSVQNYNGNNARATFGINNVRYQTLGVDVISYGSGGLFGSNYYGSKFVDYGSSYSLGCFFGSTSIPVIPDNASLSDYFNAVEYIDYANFVAGWGTQTVSPVFDPADIPGTEDFDFDNNSYEDYIIEIFNPYIEEEYPDLTIYLYDPDPEPSSETGTTDSNGNCNCYHEINVYVTENIDITNIIEFPSDWYIDYTVPTSDPSDTSPTIPMPTETMPSVDVSEVHQEFGEGVKFWLWITKFIVDESDLGLIVKFTFVIAVAGFIIWRLGGKSGD